MHRALSKRGLILAVVVTSVMLSGKARLDAAPSQAQPRPSSSSTAVEAKQEAEGYVLAPEKYREAVAFNRAMYWRYFLGVAYGALIYLGILRWRVAPRYRDWAERASSRRVVQALVYAPLLLLTLGVLNLPRRLSGHWLLRKYGLSVQGWGSWFWDWCKGQLIGVLIGTVLAWVLYRLLRRSPRRWWFYAWLVSVPLIVLTIFLTPLVIDPLFYRFELLATTQPQLVDQIERIVRRAGMQIPPERIFLMEASAKTNAVNAYVTGFGASKRVVVWDTTLKYATAQQALAVFGHEMGHYVLGHIQQGIALAVVAALIFLFLASRLVAWAARRWGARWSIRGVDDWASLPVVLLLVLLFSFLSAPLGNAYSRHIEHDADVYGLEVTHGILPHAGAVAAEFQQVAGERNLEDPAPPAFIRFWLYTHPTVNARILFARRYDPWLKGEAPRFVK